MSSERVRVVTLVDLLSLHGGAEYLAWLIATRLDPERFESTLCVSRWPPPETPDSDTSAAEALEQLQAKGIGFLPLARRRKIDIPAWYRLERFLRRERVQVVHSHKFGSNVWGTLAGMAAGVPVILAHEHTWNYEGRPLRRFLDRELIARYADRFIAVSREDQRRMIEVERIDPARTLFVPNGVPSLAPTSSRDVRAELAIAREAPVIGVVAVLRPQKAHHVLLHATAELARTWPDIQVLLAGEGPERPFLERLARDLGVERAVRFMGYRSDVSEVLRALDVAVCCSDYEGSPLAVMEYMDAGVAIVASAVGGVPDLIEQGVHGTLIAPGDPAALARAIAELLRDPQRRAAMGERARERRRAEFGIDVFIQRLEGLYCELLANSSRRLRRPAIGGMRRGG